MTVKHGHAVGMGLRSYLVEVVAPAFLFSPVNLFVPVPSMGSLLPCSDTDPGSDTDSMYCYTWKVENSQMSVVGFTFTMLNQVPFRGWS